MTTLRRFRCDDLFNFNAVNLDYFTETVRTWLLSLHLAFALRPLVAWSPGGVVRVHASTHWQP